MILSRTQNMKADKLEECVSLLRGHNANARIVTTPWDELSGAQLLETMSESHSLASELLQEIEAEHAHHEHEHHHHEHGALYIIDGHTHEGASVGTGTLTVTGHYQELEDTVRNELKALADWTAEQGGIIGHIKSSLVSTHTAMLSITEDEVNTISSDTEEVRINMAAIVFAIPLEEIKARVEDICKKLVQMTGSK